MTCNITLRASGFDISGVARNSKGDVSLPALKEAILLFLDVPYPAPAHVRDEALKRSASNAGELFDSCSFSYTGSKKHGRAALARWTGYSGKVLWPYASGNTLEKARIDLALAEATTTAEPLDPISPLPDLPPVEDVAAIETVRRFAQGYTGIIVDGNGYWHPALAAYASQYVDTRYDQTQDVLIVLGEDGEAVCTATRYVRGAPRATTLPPPTEPWMGALHEAFSASPANAALRALVAELEAQLASSARTDAYYNGGALPHADQMAANEAAYLSQRGARRDRVDFNLEMHFKRQLAAWPPAYEDRAPGPLRRFVNCLRESAARLVAKGPRA